MPCRVTVYDGSGGGPARLIGQTTNLSAHGLALQLHRDVATGTWVEALVPQLDGNPVFFRGTVIHSRRVLADAFEIGIEFGPGDSAPPF